LDAQLFTIGDDELEAYKVFDSLDEAKDYIAKKVLENPDTEYLVYNSLGDTVYFHDRNGIR
jgi:hypothetical protein